jgi:hypothetical protein
VIAKELGAPSVSRSRPPRRRNSAEQSSGLGPASPSLLLLDAPRTDALALAADFELAEIPVILLLLTHQPCLRKSPIHDIAGTLTADRARLVRAIGSEPRRGWKPGRQAQNGPPASRQEVAFRREPSGQWDVVSAPRGRASVTPANGREALGAGRRSDWHPVLDLEMRARWARVAREITRERGP